MHGSLRVTPRCPVTSLTSIQMCTHWIHTNTHTHTILRMVLYTKILKLVCFILWYFVSHFNIFGIWIHLSTSDVLNPSKFLLWHWKYKLNINRCTIIFFDRVLSKVFIWTAARLWAIYIYISNPLLNSSLKQWCLRLRKSLS